MRGLCRKYFCATFNASCHCLLNFMGPQSSPGALFGITWRPANGQHLLSAIVSVVQNILVALHSGDFLLLIFFH